MSTRPIQRLPPASRPPPGRQAFLSVHDGPGPGRLLAVPEGTLTIGRGETADVRLEHPSVSRRHARLRRRGEQFFIADLGSRNGTYLARHRVDGEVELPPGAHLSVGPALIRLRTSGDEAAGPALAGAPRPTPGSLASPPASRTWRRIAVVLQAFAAGFLLVGSLGLGLADLAWPHPSGAGANRGAAASSEAPAGASAGRVAIPGPSGGVTQRPDPLTVRAGAPTASPGRVALPRPATDGWTAPQGPRPAGEPGSARGGAQLVAASSSRTRGGVVGAAAQGDVASAPAGRTWAPAVDVLPAPASAPAVSDDPLALAARSATERPGAAWRGPEAAGRPLGPKQAPQAGPGRAPLLAAYLRGDAEASLQAARAARDGALARRLEAFVRTHDAADGDLIAGRGPEAIAGFERAMALDAQLSAGSSRYATELRSKLAGLHILAGLDREQAGDEAGARGAFLSALACDPENVRARQHLERVGGDARRRTPLTPAERGSGG